MKAFLVAFTSLRRSALIAHGWKTILYVRNKTAQICWNGIFGKWDDLKRSDRIINPNFMGKIVNGARFRDNNHRSSGLLTLNPISRRLMG